MCVCVSQKDYLLERYEVEFKVNLMQLCGKFKSAFHSIQTKAKPVVIMNNKLKPLTADSDMTKKGIIGAQVCCAMLKYAQLSHPQISMQLSECVCEQSEHSGAGKLEILYAYFIS